MIIQTNLPLSLTGLLTPVVNFPLAPVLLAKLRRCPSATRCQTRSFRVPSSRLEKASHQFKGTSKVMISCIAVCVFLDNSPLNRYYKSER